MMPHQLSKITVYASLAGLLQQTSMKYRSSRSPPRNYKVNLIDEPPFNSAQKTYFLSCVPRISRSCTGPEQIQLQLSNQLCKYLQKSVGVSVTVKPEDYSAQQEEKHMKPVTFRFTMNEYLFRVWVYEPEVQFLTSIRGAQ